MLIQTEFLSLWQTILWINMMGQKHWLGEVRSCWGVMTRWTKPVPKLHTLWQQSCHDQSLLAYYYHCYISSVHTSRCNCYLVICGVGLCDHRVMTLMTLMQCDDGPSTCTVPECAIHICAAHSGLWREEVWKEGYQVLSFFMLLGQPTVLSQFRI